MKVGIRTYLTTIGVLAGLVRPVGAVAQAQQQQRYPYILVDMGTFGGPNSSIPNFTATPNNSGVAIGAADTPRSNPNYPNVNPVPAHLDSFVEHAFH